MQCIRLAHATCEADDCTESLYQLTSLHVQIHSCAAVALFKTEPCDIKESMLFIDCVPTGANRQYIKIITIEGHEYNGSLQNLTRFHFQQLTSFIVRNTSLTGGLPPALQGPKLETVKFEYNPLMSGPIPESWGVPAPGTGILPLKVLETLVLKGSSWTGKLPKSWGASFTALTKLEIVGIEEDSRAPGLTGTIPLEWASEGGSFFSLAVRPSRVPRRSFSGLSSEERSLGVPWAV
jgi:hypothetical protein